MSPVLFLSAVLLVTGIHASPPGGARGAISQKMLDYAVHELVPILKQQALSQNIPDFSGESSGFKYTVSNIKVTDFAIGAPTLAFVSGKGLDLDLEQITLSGGMDWKYKEKHFPHLKSHGRADFHVGGSTHGKAIVLLSVVGGKPHSAISGVDVGLDHFNVKVHGSASWLYNLIIKAFEGTIKKTIQKSLSSSLQDAVDKQLNKEFATMSTIEKLPFHHPYDIAEIDYTFEDITVLSDHIAVTLRASVNDTSTSRSRYPLVPPTLPVPSSSVYGAHHITIQLSTYTIDSMFYVYNKRGLLHYLVTPNDLDKFKFLLNTDTLVVAAPGLSKWPHANMTVDAIVAEMPTSHFDSDQLKIEVAAMYEFSVITPQGPVSVFNITGPLVAAADISISQNGSSQVIHGAITNATCSPLVLNSTAVGPVSFKLVSEAIGYILDVVVPVANLLIAEGIPLPGFEGVTPMNTSLTTDSNVLSLSTDLVYKPTENV